MLTFFTESIISLEGMTAPQMFLLIGLALFFGLAISFISTYKNNPSKSFLITLALLPLCIEIVMFLVNRSIGTGLAVGGTFALIRFRSVPASAREILTFLICIITGFTLGRGFIGLAIIFVVLAFLIILLYANLKIGGDYSNVKALRIIVPEDLEYESMFNDIFVEYTKNAVLENAKTTNMGSLYELKYRVELKSGISQKEFLDKIRVKNGNLTVALGNYTLDKKDVL